MTKILIIRRDNIGDLVCTTPLVHAVRRAFPAARIDALVTAYNAPVLAGNPDLDVIHTYTKAHHRSETRETFFGVYRRRLRLMLALRRERYDYAILANCGFVPRPLRLARWVAARHIVGFVRPGAPGSALVDLAVPLDDRPRHEVEDLFRILAPLGIAGPPGPARIFPDPDSVQAAQQALAAGANGNPAIAVHISSRQTHQRWPIERFASLMRALCVEYPLCHFVLFWSPGSETNPLHPGDDQNATQLLSASAGLSVTAFPTRTLNELIAGLSVCDLMICSDGGAMHIGAALGKPIVCFFGDSDPKRWHPWGVPYVLLQPSSRNVADISAAEACTAFGRLMRDRMARTSAIDGFNTASGRIDDHG